MTIIGVLVIENRTNTCWCCAFSAKRAAIKEFLANLAISSATVIRSSSADGLTTHVPVSTCRGRCIATLQHMVNNTVWIFR